MWVTFSKDYFSGGYFFRVIPTNFPLENSIEGTKVITEWIIAKQTIKLNYVKSPKPYLLVFFFFFFFELIYHSRGSGEEFSSCSFELIPVLNNLIMAMHSHWANQLVHSRYCSFRKKLSFKLAIDSPSPLASLASRVESNTYHERFILL